ncbi:MAG: M23 family metallopeptidase [candidate division KSB1 bacterium]|nr:M23 family metallopeptidase [candidate division KSB1 bacterium]
MAISKRKHRKSIKLLIVPDDKDEPRSYSITNFQLQIAKIMAVVLVVHILAGIVFYGLYYRLDRRRDELLVINRQLEENNNRINELMSEFESLEQFQSKVGVALGLQSQAEEALSSELVDREDSVIPANLSSYNQSGSMSEDELQSVARNKLYFLKQSKSVVHDLEKSIPTMLPVDGVFTRDFSNTIYKDERQHQGVDIATERGTLVKTAADGVILFSGWTYDLGNMVIVYHGNGFYTYYGHNQLSLKRRGEFVKKGEPIALVGSTGISSAPHLHFEVWKDGKLLDPKQFLLAFSDL